MDEPEETITTTASVGEQLLAAREAAGISLEDIAAQTRIPTRHLQSIENSDWDALPAPTYTMGFAKSYATAVGLDRNEIADQLRAEMGGMRAAITQSEVFEPVDPARVMPRWLVIAAVAAAALIVALLLWNQSRSLDAPDDVPTETAAPTDNLVAAAPATPATAASGPVVITANEQVWIQVKDGPATLREGILEAGQSFEVPATAQAPVLTTGKPEAIRISVGTADAPPVGPAATKVTNVSLLGPDLLRGPAAAPAAAQAVSPAAPRSQAPRRNAPARAPAPAVAPPAENSADPAD